MSCEHQWEEIRSYKFESEFDRIMEDLTSIEMPAAIMSEVVKRGVITVVRCEHCGEVRHIKAVL